MVEKIVLALSMTQLYLMAVFCGVTVKVTNTTNIWATVLCLTLLFI
jgi:hypothetical protein